MVGERPFTSWVVGPSIGSPPSVAVAAARAGATGFLAVTGDAEAWAVVAERAVSGTVGALVGPSASAQGTVVPADAPVLLAARPWTVDAVRSEVAAWAPRPVAVEVTTAAEAADARDAGATTVVVKGHESGGYVGDASTFVLLQQVLALDGWDLPVLARGGVGLHTAGAVLVAGGAGVVLDDQVALAREADLPPALVAAVAAMDGSETVVVGSHRLYTRPDLPVADLERDVPLDVVAARLGPDLRTDLVPMGQDASTAAALARTYVTVGGVVQAVEAAARHALAEADRLRPLAPGSALAGSLGLRVPVAQGPMTRVSDRAAFAAAVAADGALPFLALALLRGPEVRSLLEETRELLGDRPWGVGILGFVPPELREEQLEVVREIAPPVALIAGGRPSQAAPLEREGMATFLHVPSPGLLDRFLADGARRFVFEGRECGGHVGPRTSFVLWNAQVARLLAFADTVAGPADRSLADVQVLLAGGVHDECSAAMAAVVAAPLAARGAQVGVLMGTAYLFTDAAVDHGAVQATFQRVAVACRETALLHTSPGHAVRCATSPYVQVFGEAERRLAADGVPKDERWLALEDLNLGRLRVASKGVERVGDELVAVDDARQWDEGMFMIGDVASLRHETTTVARLHEQVTTGATDLVHRGAAGPAAGAAARTRPRPEPLDIAIVGMSAIYPGAAEVDELWANVVAGVDAVTEVPAERWEWERWHAEGDDARPGVTTPSRWGGFLPPVPFDALAYGIPPRSLASIEPVQLLALEVARRALADAGYEQRPFDRERTSVIFGAEAGTDLSAAYGLRASYRSYLGDLPPELDEHLPRLTEDSFPGMLTNVIAGRVANRLDLGGSNYTVDAACASSLAALDAACKELVAGTSDLVLCGGADLHNGIHDYLLFSSVHALSPGGRCRTFDAGADGIVLGEGVACVALKRVADAERDGDRIHAVIRAVASSSDGRHLGLTAPRPEGQERALRRAYEQAGISPAAVGLVEAHGTGTAVGDRTELSTLRDVFEAEGSAPGSCAVGSVKSNIGHTKCAAGLAGLVKATLAVERGVLPPTLHVETPNPAYDPEAGPFLIHDEARPWLGAERVAGVSAFGFGGTNFHAVVERYRGADEPVHGLDAWPAELVVLRGTPEQAAETADLLAARARAGGVRLRDLARTAWERAEGPVHAAVVARDLDDLVEALDDVRAGRASRDRVFLADPVSEGESADGGGPGRVAFVFSGQGSQRPGMLADLFVAFPALRRHLAGADDLVPVLFPPAAFDPAGRAAQRAAVTDTRVAQPGLGVVEVALADLLGRLGVRPDLAGGHSYGEVAALAAFGAVPSGDLVALSRARADAILSATGDDPGAMAAVAACRSDVEAVLDGVDDDVVVANDNAPLQTVISGSTDAVAAAVARLDAKGLAARPLPVACAFHSPVVAGAGDRFRAALDAADLRVPSVEVWSNTTARPHAGTVEELRAALADQIEQPVRWTEQVQAMWDAGARTFVEIGPGRVLTGLVGKILGDRPHRAIACDVAGEAGVPRLLIALGQLAVAGVPVQLDPLFADRARRVDLRARPEPAGWLVDGHLVRTSDGRPVAGGLHPVTERPEVLTVAGSTDTREDAVHRYLDGMADLVAAQRDVMLALLGADPAAPSVPSARRAERVAAGGEPVAVVAPAAAPPGPGPSSGPVADVDLGPEALTAMVLALIAERTGYPEDMLDPALDLEADLSIDSIKRIEIIGELFDRLPGFSTDASEVSDETVEELARIKTIGGIVEWIGAQGDAGSGPATASPPAPATAPAGMAAGEAGPAGPGDTAGPPVPARALRSSVTWEPVPLGPAVPLAGPVAVVGDPSWTGPLASLLAGQGGEVTVHADLGGVAAGAAAVVDLRPLAGAVAPVDVLPLVQAAAGAGTARVLVAHRAPDAEAFGVGGLLRTAARERPDTAWRSVAWAGDDDPDALAAAVAAELAAPDGPVAVRTDGAERRAAVLHPLGPVAGPDDAPADVDLADPAAAPVALLTGGAQGITARVALALAARGHVVELVGRSAPPGPEDPATAGADTAADIRRALVAAGRSDPRAIEAEVAAILRDRRITATLDALADLGAEHRYHALDVRDGGAVADLVADVVARRGRLDLVVHGAGVLEDRFLADKDAASFARVFDTKVRGADALLDATGDLDCRLVLFGSIAGVFGNRGQADYAAANDALDERAHAHHGDRRRVIALDWGPWAGGGMVTPELEAEYGRRGIGLVDPADGVGAVLQAVTDPAPPAQVVVMRAEPDAFGGR